MRVVVAPDSLKDALPAAAAAEAIAAGVRRALPAAEVRCLPIADGGEGTLAALTAATGGRVCEAVVADPLGRPCAACWGLSGNGRIAVIEMACASGLERLAPAERDPTRTSTHGTGELIRAALDAGARHLVIGIGGSATVDGGMGMAAALGVRFLDAGGRCLMQPHGGCLADVARIDVSGLDARVAGARLEVACDVTNPLTGPEGAARVYAPQKGATPEQVELLEVGLAHLAGLFRRDLGCDVNARPGAGAAGGLGAGLAAFLGATLRRGAEIVLDAVGVDAALDGAALAFTAEGRADAQSGYGKATAALAARAARHGVPCILLAGALGPGYEALYTNGVTAALAIADGPLTLAASIARTPILLERAAEAAARLWCAGGRAAWDGRVTPHREV